jgi:hypothetical protein
MFLLFQAAVREVLVLVLVAVALAACWNLHHSHYLQQVIQSQLVLEALVALVGMMEIHLNLAV